MSKLFGEYYNLATGKSSLKIVDYDLIELATRKLDGRIAKTSVTPAVFFDPSTPSVGPTSYYSKKIKDDKVIVDTKQDIYVIPKDEYESAKAYWEKMNVSKSTARRRDDEEIRGKAERDRAMRDQRMIKDAQNAGDIGYKSPF